MPYPLGIVSISSRSAKSARASLSQDDPVRLADRSA